MGKSPITLQLRLSADARRDRDRAQFDHRIPGANRFVRTVPAPDGRRNAGAIKSRRRQARSRIRTDLRRVCTTPDVSRGGLAALISFASHSATTVFELLTLSILSLTVYKVAREFKSISLHQPVSRLLGISEN
jgi:hypothetical protein